MIHINNATRAKLLNNVGATYYQMSNFIDALKYFTTALEIQRRWLEGPVRRESSVFDGSVTLGNMGKVYLEQADYNMAIYVYEEALLVRLFYTIFCFQKKKSSVLANYSSTRL
jgi:tetratricopeptide (TPR) repeat protein